MRLQCFTRATVAASHVRERKGRASRIMPIRRILERIFFRESKKPLLPFGKRGF
jgi:hypothetical protein